MDQELPSRSYRERRDTVGDPGDPQEQDEGEPARSLPDDRSDEAVLRLLVTEGDAIDGGDGADHHDGDCVAVAKRASRDAASAQNLAAQPNAVARVADPQDMRSPE